ncbi:MAG: SBBP repeat-containing protein [Rudaea sp.]
MHAAYGSLPLVFEERASSADGPAAFVARSAGYAVAVSAQRVVVALRRKGEAPTWLAFRFVGADAGAAIAGLDALTTRIHRIRYADARDRVDAPTYARVGISALYPGIDVVFHGHGRALEYDVVVAPGADPARFAMHVDGAERVRVGDRGELVVASAAGPLTLEPPVAYQDIGDVRRTVTSAFDVDREGDVRIRVGDYDPTHVLVIDPIVSYATYLGGSNFDQGMAIAVDAAGNAYVAGYTMSTDFPIVSGFDRSLGKRGDVDAFVSKLNADGTALVWSTYLGGSTGVDRAVGIAIDASGSVYVTGHTSRDDFPTSATAWQKGTTAGGGFVTKLVPAGNALAYSTYVAGATPSAIAVDASGNAYVAGSAMSAFAATTGALQPATGNPSGETGFVLKLDATGSAPLFATFLGGSIGEDATSLAVDARGNAFVAGWTSSPDFPVRNAYQDLPGGGKDAFVAKLDNAGAELLYSTRLGGVLDDAANAIAIDAAGDAYIAGETYSWNFPVKDGFQMTKAGARLVNSSVGNAFVAKLSPQGDALAYASFLGGEVCLTLCQLVFGPLPQYPADAAYGIAVDSVGHAYVTGLATSYTFPLVDSSAARKQADNEDSAFAAKVAISGRSLVWSTFLRTGYGEADNHWTRIPPGAASAVAVDGSDAAYVTGDSDGASNFAATAGAFQTAAMTGAAAIVAKFMPAPALTLSTSSALTDTATPITLTATLAGAASSGSVNFMNGSAWIGGGTLVGNSATLTVTLPAGIHALSAMFYGSGSGSDSPVVRQIVDVPLVCN